MQLWTEEIVFHEGDSFFSKLSQTILHAKKTIDLETYIFERDELGLSILDHLAHAARRGVRVRILLDGFGCSQWSYYQLAPLQEAGIQVRFFHPLPWQHARFHVFRFLILRRMLLGFWKLNRRNHRKSCTLDGHTAFLGGMNISARHSGRRSGKNAWRDTSVKVRGKPVTYLVHAFNLAWNHPQSLVQRWKQYRRLPGRSSAIQLNVSRKQRHTAYSDFLKKVIGAKKRVWITNPYFVPDLSLLRVLRFAAWAGVDVRLLFPNKNDVWGMKWATKAFYLILLAGGVRIFEYRPSILHAKIVVVDDWVKVGSSNLNSRSLLHDLEADVILSKPESLRSIEEQFNEDLLNSKEVNLSSWRKRSLLTQVLERMVLVFRRWL